MNPTEPIIDWMLGKIAQEGCVYQDDVVDHLVKTKQEDLLRENADGNLVLGKALLNAFRKATPQNVVWVKPDFYWRLRVREDDVGREARG